MQFATADRPPDANAVWAADARRARVLDAMVWLGAERGFANVTVGELVVQAGVSRRTFYEEFGGLRECLLEVMEDGYRRVRGLIDSGFDGASSWREGLRRALALLLDLFDHEPRLAWVWFVEVLAAGTWALERRERHIRLLTETIVERWPLPPDAPSSPLMASGVMESLLGLIHAHLLAGRRERLIALLGPLMGMIVEIYVDERAAAVEIALCRDLVSALQVGRRPCAGKDLIEVPKMLLDAKTRRARAVLFYLAEHPGASNRQIATAIGVASRTQASTLLARLAGMGLLNKHVSRPGHPNKWQLTDYGAQVHIALAGAVRHRSFDKTPDERHVTP